MQQTACHGWHFGVPHQLDLPLTHKNGDDSTCGARGNRQQKRSLVFNNNDRGMHGTQVVAALALYLCRVLCDCVCVSVSGPSTCQWASDLPLLVGRQPPVRPSRPNNSILQLSAATKGRPDFLARKGGARRRTNNVPLLASLSAGTVCAWRVARRAGVSVTRAQTHRHHFVLLILILLLPPPPPRPFISRLK
jgi:hypothetical protein